MTRTRTKTTIAAIAAVLCTGLAAYGQSAQPVIPLQAGSPVGSGNPLYIQGSLSTSGFTAASTGTPISVTTGGVTGTLPAGVVVVATNVGATNGAYCALGASATTASQYLSPGGGWFAFTVGASTQLTCITSTSTTTVNMTGGAGLPTGTGGGGGGSSGGGAVYGPTANGSAAANPPVIIGGTANGGATGNVANAMIVAGNTAGTTNPAIIVADPNVLAAVNAAVPGYYATAYNTCSQLTGTTAPICVDLNGNMYANISRYMGTAGTANAAVMTVQGIASMTPFLANPGTSALWNASWAGGTLGSMANYGTSPGAVLVPGVNAFVTNPLTAGTAGSPSTQVVSTQGVPGGTSLPVINGANTYNTIAASQTAQALTGGSGGATGDYLSHCTITPGTTSPGTVIIYDNSTAVYTFAGGSSSVSTLISWPVAFTAVSASGAWKVTTGTNVTVFCVGKFH